MINLEKGARINLSKDAPELKRVRIGLGWDANKFDSGTEFDLDASAFVCKMDASGAPKLLSDDYFVFYGSTHISPDGFKSSPDNAVRHSGDNRTGAGDGDDETMTVDLAALTADASEISIIVTIHKADERRQNFGQVSNSYIKLYDDETGKEIAKYALEDEFSTETAVQFGSLYKKDGHWLFKAVGAGFKKGLADFVRIYGGNLG